MNIIKLKDKKIENDSQFANFFNKIFKGKYAYWVQMRYIFPLSIPYCHYIDYEQYDDNDFDPNSPNYKFKNSDIVFIDTYCDDACMVDFVKNYIDEPATDEANDIKKFYTSNDYTPDADITIDELKNFRTWLAIELLKFDTNVEGHYEYSRYDEETTHMLDYYAHGMYNDIIKYLSIFGTNVSVDLYNDKKACGCCGNSNLSSLYNSNISICDASVVYKTNIYNKMVFTFSDLNFWTQFDSQFIKTFKLYIDNIIKINLPINNMDNDNHQFQDCVCNEPLYDKNINILERLSKSLQFIADNDITSHKNYIYDALHDWSSYLYEYMQWA